MTLNMIDVVTGLGEALVDFSNLTSVVAVFVECHPASLESNENGLIVVSETTYRSTIRATDCLNRVYIKNAFYSFLVC